MNLEKNYKLLDVVRDDGIRTFAAQEIASGNALQVHLFVSAQDQSLFDQVRALPLSSRRAIWEFGDELRIPYLITDPLPGGTDARAWLSDLVRPAAKISESKAADPKPIEAKPTEGKPQPIKASVWKTGTPIPDPLFPDDPAETKGDAPGEFTRMFQVKVPEAPATKPPEEEPGEFTRMFQIPAEKPAVNKPAADAPGEFTRMFQAPLPPAASAKTAEQPPFDPPSFDPEATKLFKIPDLPPAPPHAAAPPEPSAEPGEFTRFFQSPLAPTESKSNIAEQAPFPPPPPPPPAPNRPGEFTQMFGSPSGKIPSAAPPLGTGKPFNGSATGAFARPVQPPPGAQAGSSKPPAQGQFAQMMSAGSAPTLGQQQTPAAAAVPAKKSNLPLIVILVALALFAVLIVAFFAMRH